MDSSGVSNLLCMFGKLKYLSGEIKLCFILFYFFFKDIYFKDTGLKVEAVLAENLLGRLF